MALNKAAHEEFSRFFEQPSREAFRDLLQSHFGETDALDFKADWPPDSKLAKHILALANSGGGAIVLGVRQERSGRLVSVGLPVVRDKAQIAQALHDFFPPTLDYQAIDFAYADSEYKAIAGKLFQVLVIESEPRHLPFLSQRDATGLRSNAIYIRRGTQSIEASHDELERLINRRIESGYSSRSILELQEHLDQLKTLYSAMPKLYSGMAFSSLQRALSQMASLYESSPNPHYPKQSYDAFIGDLIVRKKHKIERVLELTE